MFVAANLRDALLLEMVKNVVLAGINMFSFEFNDETAANGVGSCSSSLDTMLQLLRPLWLWFVVVWSSRSFCSKMSR